MRIATRNVSPGWAFSVNTIGWIVSASVRDTIAPFENTVIIVKSLLSTARSSWIRAPRRLYPFNDPGSSIRRRSTLGPVFHASPAFTAGHVLSSNEDSSGCATSAWYRHSSNGIVTIDSSRSVRALYGLLAAIPWAAQNLHDASNAIPKIVNRLLLLAAGFAPMIVSPFHTLRFQPILHLESIFWCQRFYTLLQLFAHRGAKPG